MKYQLLGAQKEGILGTSNILSSPDTQNYRGSKVFGIFSAEKSVFSLAEDAKLYCLKHDNDFTIAYLRRHTLCRKLFPLYVSIYYSTGTHLF